MASWGNQSYVHPLDAFAHESGFLHPTSVAQQGFTAQGEVECDSAYDCGGNSTGNTCAKCVSKYGGRYCERQKCPNGQTCECTAEGNCGGCPTGGGCADISQPCDANGDCCSGACNGTVCIYGPPSPPPPEGCSASEKDCAGTCIPANECCPFTGDCPPGCANCPSGQTQSGCECVASNPCSGVICGENEYCVNGECHCQSGTAYCPRYGKCVRDGACNEQPADICASANCPPNSSCFRYANPPCVCDPGYVRDGNKCVRQGGGGNPPPPDEEEPWPDPNPPVNNSSGALIAIVGALAVIGIAASVGRK